MSGYDFIDEGDAALVRAETEEQRRVAEAKAFIEGDLMQFLADNSEWSEFAASLHAYGLKHGRLTPKQQASAERMKEKIEARRRQQAEIAPAVAQQCDHGPERGLDLSSVPSGLYAVPGGDTRLRVRIDNVTKPGKWLDWVFVKDGSEYGQGQRYGAQKPGETYRGKIADALAIIAQDPLAASKAYGRLVGHCGVCGRLLEKEESIEAGIGPVCASRF